MDVLIGKIESMARCLARIREEHQNCDENLNPLTRQDSMVLNLLRACEQSIDIANIIIAKKRLDTPKTSREAFDILCEHHLIDSTMAVELKKMVGFRNIAVHDYRKLDPAILNAIITRDITLFERFTDKIKDLMRSGLRGPGDPE